MADKQYTQRLIDQSLAELVSEHPAVMLLGARAVGKSTSAARLVSEVKRLDVPAQAASFRADPDLALRRLDGPVLLDEWQEVPEVLWAVKRAVDAGAPAGSFVLTGSVTPRSDIKPTFGRIAPLTMWPVVQREIAGSTTPALTAFFERDPLDWKQTKKPWDLGDYASALHLGGMPMATFAPRRRDFVLEAYVNDIAATARSALSPRLDADRFNRWVVAVAEQSGQQPSEQLLLSIAGVARATGQRFDDLLEALFLEVLTPAWHTNRIKRLSATPKRYLADTGITATLLGCGVNDILDDHRLSGHLLDSFVAQQLRAECALPGAATAIHYLRTHEQREVDILLTRGRRVCAVEVTASATPSDRKLQHLRFVRERLGEQFHLGVLLYTGPDVILVEDRIVAAPVSVLWAS